MKRLKMLMPVAIAAVTFALGAGAGTVWQMILNVMTPSETETVQTISPPAEIRAAVPATEPVTYAGPVIVRPDDSKAEDAEPAEDPFDATGMHYAYSEKLPKSFSKLDYIWIEARDWDVDPNDFPSGKAIPPKGEIMIRKKFRFARVAIGGREIAFSTETIGGISYRFVGSFPSSSYCDTAEEDAPDLTGRLIRIKDGKWDAEAKIDLYTGCGC